MSGPSHIHLSAEQIQAFLEGDVSPHGERSLIEEHLAVCAQCSGEVDAWRVLFADLASLPAAEPRYGFADRVMSDVRIPQEKPSWLAALFPRKSTQLSTRLATHLAQDVLQDLADGMLPARRAARARAHLAACATCTGEVETWRGVMSALARVPRLTPSETFATRVMTALARPARAVVPKAASAASNAPAWGRALAVARRMVPRSRRAWAAVCGVAVTPAAIFGLVFWVVFSHPTLTPQALASYAAWQLADLLALAWNGIVSNGLEVASASGVESLLQSLSPSPLMLAGGALAYSAVAAVALRVLYKNLIIQRRYARVSSH